MTPANNNDKLTEDEVLEYLSSNTDFLLRHPELLEIMKLPKNDLGGNVEDFQHFAIKKLQENIKSTKEEFYELIKTARDNNSAQYMVHQAILRLVRARSLEQLLEVITIDLAQLFDVDVVRLALEMELPDSDDISGNVYSSHKYLDNNYSGIVFVSEGICYDIFGDKGFAVLCDDVVESEELCGFEQIFSNCEWLIRSYVILRLNLQYAPSDALIAFAVRDSGRFHRGQAVDLLRFLAQIIEECLDNCLQQEDIFQ